MDLRPRALIQRLNSSTTVAEPDDTDDADETGTEPVVTVPAQPVRGGSRLPNWWEPKRDVVDLDKHAPEEEPCQHPHPHAVHARLTGQLVAYWCEDCDTQLPVFEDTEDDEYEEAQEDEEGGDKVPPRLRRVWSMRGSGKRVYSRPTYNRGKSPRRSLAEAWNGMSPLTRHGLYNGSALALGWSLGVPQFFTAETAYLAATYDSWTDFYVCVWYGVAIAIWMFDQRTRNWLPPLALAARMPLISLIVGVLLYGNPA
ncbi:hypothetical protein [Streptomyces sp. PA03-2a]|uniref:hypothetical protein n=1 Tax=Streptomyces sp. PA03-2a TaxID=3028701 RepID=UPI0029A42519|nr:hypothetical protein [Streptomyces sp. PA03-2a]MDX2732906.1 hypothetical protein [Streptomyces sp. PA03-2a]